MLPQTVIGKIAEDVAALVLLEVVGGRPILSDYDQLRWTRGEPPRPGSDFVTIVLCIGWVGWIHEVAALAALFPRSHQKLVAQGRHGHLAADGVLVLRSKFGWHQSTSLCARLAPGWRPRHDQI